MRKSIPIAVAALLVAHPGLGQETATPILTTPELQPVVGVDLGIADDQTYRRPNSWAAAPQSDAGGNLLPTERIMFGDLSGPASRPGLSIAWRNAAQVEEIEVRVRNLGTEPGVGRVFVEVMDESGRVLLHLEPPPELREIQVPAYGQGGREGIVLRMAASRALNNLIDRFDQEDRRYDVRATVVAVGAEDQNPFDNSKTKSWHMPNRVDPGFTNVMNYVFENHETAPVEVQWAFERTEYPAGWAIEGIPASTDPFILQPGERIVGSLRMEAPMEIEEGAFVESRLTLVRTSDGSPFAQREWFQVHDTIAPTVSNYRLVMLADHRLAIQVLVADNGSGVREATGVTTEFSTDGGLTWVRKAHNYKVGNFVVPTLFEAVLGPFAPDTDVQLRFMAMDTAGNVASVIPADAAAIIAPARAEALLDFAYVFPRTAANPLFTLEPGLDDLGDIAARFAAAIATNPTVENLTGLADALARIQTNPEALATLQDTIVTMQRNPATTVAADRLEAMVAALSPPAAVTTVEVQPLELVRIDAPGADFLRMDTIALTVE